MKAGRWKLLDGKKGRGEEGSLLLKLGETLLDRQTSALLLVWRLERVSSQGVYNIKDQYQSVHFFQSKFMRHFLRKLLTYFYHMIFCTFAWVGSQANNAHAKSKQHGTVSGGQV